jgi:nicotinate (nicotinamide) nucleotide adenylyltransferase
MSKKIGIFAGTFDPIHEGHLAFASAALALGLEKVMFLVEPRPWRKQGVRSLEHRQAMVSLAIYNEPKFGTIILERSRLTPHETLPILQARFKGYELVLLFGDDVISYMAGHIAAWPHIEELATNTSLIIASRRHDQKQLSESLQVLKRDYDLPFRYQFAEPGKQHINATDIRLALKRRQQPTGVPAEVLGYIHSHRLYVSTARVPK